MEKIILTGLAVLSLLAGAHAQIITQWNFESLTLDGAAGVAPVVTGGSLSPDVGSGLASALHSSTATVYSTPSGNDSSKSFSSNHWSVGDYYQFQTSTTGFSDIHIGFSQYGSNTGPAEFKLQYSTDGATFVDLANGAYTVPSTTSWNPTTYYNTDSVFYFDLSSISEINDVGAVYFRLTSTSTVSVNGGTVASTGTNRVDQFTVSQGSVDISPVPEPATVALIVLGLGAAVWGVRRKRSMA